MARHAVVDIDRGFDKITEELLSLKNSVLVIGVQEGDKTRGETKRSRKQTPGISIAQYAAQNEFGTDKIPQRSFIRSTFDENETDINRAISAQIGKVIDQKITTKSALDKVGQYITIEIKRKIRAIVFPPNSPMTIALKKSSKPLIDFGAMIDAIRHVIRKANK